MEAMMAEETAAEELHVEPKKASNAGQLILILLITLISNATGAGVTWYLVSNTLAHAVVPAAEGGSAEATEEDQIAAMLENGAVVPLEPFVVNLADPDAARYLRIKISLMVDNKAKVAEVTENQALQLKVRDLILQTLTSKTSQDLIDDQGKIKLKQEIQEHVQGYFRDPKLMDIVFTEFVIQL
jgi:flagellar FliL protein